MTVNSLLTFAQIPHYGYQPDILLQMKSTATTNRRYPLTLWEQYPQVKHGVVHRMRDLTAALESLQAAMHSSLTETEETCKNNPFFEDADAMRVLHRCKAELDQLRRILWFHIEEATGKSGPDMDQEQKDRRSRRITDLLGTLRPQPAASPAVPALESGSFFERLDQVIDVHMRDKTPKPSLAKPRKS